MYIGNRTIHENGYELFYCGDIRLKVKNYNELKRVLLDVYGLEIVKVDISYDGYLVKLYAKEDMITVSIDNVETVLERGEGADYFEFDMPTVDLYIPIQNKKVYIIEKAIFTGI